MQGVGEAPLLSPKDAEPASLLVCGLRAIGELVEFARHVIGAQMRIPEKHLRIPVAADQAYLGDGQAHFEKATDGLVAQVVKVEVLDPRPALQAILCKAQGVWPII